MQYASNNQQHKNGLRDTKWKCSHVSEHINRHFLTQTNTYTHCVATCSYHRCSNPSLLLSHSPRLGSIQSGSCSALPIPDERLFTIQLTVINYHHRHYYRDSTTSKGPSKPSHQGELSHGIKIWFWCFHVRQQTTKMAVFNSGIHFHSKTSYLLFETSHALVV